jgi:hypothetical protein
MRMPGPGTWCHTANHLDVAGPGLAPCHPAAARHDDQYPEQVEERVAELARRPARDPQLVRKATASLRTEPDPPRLPWAAALEVEPGAQLWSLRRRAGQ